MKKALAIAAFALLGCSIIMTCDVSREGLIIDIKPGQIQERLDKKFPITKQYLVFLKLTLADPRVDLREGSNRIGFGLSAATNISVDGDELAGRAHVTAGLRYDPERGSLFLVDPRVEALDISLLPEKYKDEVTQAASLATQEFLDDYEVYRLDQRDFIQAFPKLVLRDVAVQNGLLRLTFGPGK